MKILLKANDNVSQIIENDIKLGTDNLVKIVGTVDGLQLSNNKLGTSRHFSNVLFNTMRGGIFDDSYHINRNDFILFLQSTNKKILKTYKKLIDSLDERISLFDLEASYR